MRQESTWERPKVGRPNIISQSVNNGRTVLKTGGQAARGHFLHGRRPRMGRPNQLEIVGRPYLIK